MMGRVPARRLKVSSAGEEILRHEEVLCPEGERMDRANKQRRVFTGSRG